MKLKYLNVQNCRALLPDSDGLPTLKRLDECLDGINNKYPGSIRSLIKTNEKSMIRCKGSRRLCVSHIKIAQGVDFQERVINTRAILEDRRAPAEFMMLQYFGNTVSQKIIVPLQYLLKGWGNAREGHQCYIHYVSHNMDKKVNLETMQWNDSDSDNYYYAGITSRDWLKRLNEHIGEIRRGSAKSFHKAWRESLGKNNVQFSSYLREINQSYEEAMDWEEKKVDSLSKDANCLNMIPGGFKGLKFLHKLRITDRVKIPLEQRERAIAKYAKQNRRKGVPNPFIAELWKDDEYYLKIIEARPKTLSREQVLLIRELNGKGWSLEKITKEIKAINQAQVKRVIEGKTYRRYH
ncbi:hypothetical protein [Lentiprolixibacter aurantiacus]|uniref:GIY-YIG domain-containing protein n=1 Tax=Lentiprolixibacter aurantiacus TaxID=2993939 RepID=A0AAE3MK18_9FLAO|nr:hypothetical protein [Lentiprolixibacter aurantiacus]MCX2718761.1 hypothetical protein [Lentiprolixibacter aurantiacus]